jgi:formylglycine-generating enzyme required for sulfatase activity
MVQCPARGKSAAFWIGATHVTNAQWLRVTGKARKGGADVPAAGMSMREIEGFIAELNRRFAAKVPRAMRFRLPSTNELDIASTADGECAADASALGVLGPSLADKKSLAAADGIAWESVMANLPCRVRTKPPNAWGVYDIVGQGRTVCRETEGADKNGKAMHVQLGPDDVAERSLVGEWGWNSTLRLALGVE